MGMDSPAQVCKFLVDSLQGHRDGCVCCLVGKGRVVVDVESLRSRGRSKQEEVLVFGRG